MTKGAQAVTKPKKLSTGLITYNTNKKPLVQALFGEILIYMTNLGTTLAGALSDEPGTKAAGAHANEPSPWYSHHLGP